MSADKSQYRPERLHMLNQVPRKPSAALLTLRESDFSPGRHDLRRNPASVESLKHWELTI